MAKKIFEIEWDDSLGPEWFNEDNLRSCISGDTHIGYNLNVKVEDVTKKNKISVATLNMELNHMKHKAKLLERDKLNS